MEAFQTKNIALFIDFENIHSEEFDVERLVERLKERGRLIVKKAYGDWGRFIRVKQTMLFNSVELVELPAVGYRGKNSSDIKLTIDALETAFHRPYIDTFVVVSGDSDFTPLISKLRELDRYVIVVSSKDNTSKLLKGFCDELIYIASVCGGEEETLSIQTGYKLLQRAIDSLENLRGEARGSLVKSQMVRLDPSFNEENFGFKQFRRFLEQAERDSIIRLQRLADGEHRVSLPGSDKSGEEPAPGRKTPKREASTRGKPAVATAGGNSEAAPPARSRPAPAAPAAAEPAPPVAMDPERLQALTSIILLGVSLARHHDQAEVDLNELAHCCKRLDPKTTPEHYGIPKSRGFKGLVQMVQDQELLQISYQAAGNHYRISLTPAGDERLKQMPRPRTYLEHRYRTLLKNSLFRARFHNEKLVHGTLVTFLEASQSLDQPPTVREFLAFAANRITTLGPGNLRQVLGAFSDVDVLTLAAAPEGGAWEDSIIMHLEPWPVVVEEIVNWQIETLEEETGEPIRKDLYLQILEEENNGNPLEELGIELVD